MEKGVGGKQGGDCPLIHILSPSMQNTFILSGRLQIEGTANDDDEAN